MAVAWSTGRRPYTSGIIAICGVRLPVDHAFADTKEQVSCRRRKFTYDLPRFGEYKFTQDANNIDYSR
jgi:hypothetical protein